MSNGYAVKHTAWRAALWWLVPPLMAAVIVVLPRLASPNPFTMSSFESVTYANGKWILQEHESGKYFFRHDGHLYRTNCTGHLPTRCFEKTATPFFP